MEAMQALEQLDTYAKMMTPFQFVAANEALNQLSTDIGFEPDQLKYVLSLFAMYPLALLYVLLPGEKLKHLFSIVLGILLAQFVFGSAWVHSFVTSTITYLMMALLPTKHVPYLVFAFNMVYLTASHIYRIYVDYMGWSLDFTGIQMLLVIKLTSFAYNYYDGRTISKNAKATASMQRVMDSRKKLAINRLPSLLEFYGYVYCFTTLLAGPAFEIREYLDVTSSRKFYFKGNYQNPPSRTVAVISKLAAGITFLIVYSVGAPLFPASNLYDDQMLNEPILKKIGILWMTIFFYRVKYYVAWKIAEGSTVLCGFGFEGFDDDGKGKGWSMVSNMDVVAFETSQSIRTSSRTWNKGTQAWLERYVYLRTGNSLIATYFCSAFWHGFYPGYYLFFMSVPIATSVQRLAYKKLRPWFLKEDGTSGLLKWLYDILSFVSNSLCKNYMVLPFVSLSWEFSIKALSGVYFSGHIVLLVTYAFLIMCPTRKLKK